MGKIFDHDIEDILNKEWYEIDLQELDIDIYDLKIDLD